MSIVFYQIPVFASVTHTCMFPEGISQYPYQREQYAVWPPAYYKEMMRK